MLALVEFSRAAALADVSWVFEECLDHRRRPFLSGLAFDFRLVEIGGDISKERLSNLPMILPPLALQRQFVEIAAQEEKVKANLKKSIADVDNIITGLING